MTRNKARKSAARARAAATGERYVVALRATEQSPVGGTALHRLMHRMPRVPAHVEGGLRGRRNRAHRQPVRTHGEPRVLIGWQNRIARLVGSK